jgi:hypothetical protein
MPINKLRLMLRGREEMALEHAISTSSARFPGESRDPFPRHWETSKAIATPSKRESLVPWNDGPRLFAGEAFKVKMGDSSTPS